MKRRSTLRMATVALTVLAAGCRAVSEKTDIGRPWKEIALPFDADVHGLFFLDQDTGWAVGGERAVKGGLIATTHDGGTTWSVQTNVVTGLSNPERFWFMAVRFVDSNRGWVGGAGGVILRTLDGGKTWDTQHRGSASDAIADLFFLDQDIGWAAKRNGVLWTTDGGETWTAAGGRYLDGYAVQFLDEANGFVAGQSGILKSTDGGRSWEHMSAPKVVYYGLHFLTPLLGWVVGERGTIVHTRDGGASWEIQKTGLTTFPLLRDLKFADERRGFAVGFVPASGRANSMILQTRTAVRPGACSRKSRASSSTHWTCSTPSMPGRPESVRSRTACCSCAGVLRESLPPRVPCSPSRRARSSNRGRREVPRADRNRRPGQGGAGFFHVGDRCLWRR